jgi:hypothetical protein
MHLKPHRWTVYLAYAVDPETAAAVEPGSTGADVDIDLEHLPRTVSPVVCFDCGIGAPGDDHCPSPPRPGYPG